MADNWRPKELIGIPILNIRTVRSNQVSKKGFVFNFCRGTIDSESAMILKLKGKYEDFRITPISDK